MDNPQAFPGTQRGTFTDEHTPGMTLLDYFAGQALAGLCANPSGVAMSERDELEDLVARTAYMVAAAMLTERKRQDGEGR